MKLSIKQLELTLGGTKFKYDAEISGGIFGVFGTSGSGKSTLMKLICGIEHGTGGRLEFNGRVFFDHQRGINLPAQRRNVGVVFQEHYLFPHLSIEQNLRFGMRFTSKRNISFASVTALLDLAPLLNKKPNQLSGGERQRAAIGRAMLQQPQILLLDEPFSNLDRNKRSEIISYLIRIHRQFEIPLLIISHDLEDILKLTQSLIIVENQTILATGDYLSIAEQAIVPHLISPKRFINTVELIHQQYQPKDRLNQFGLTKDSKALLTTNTGYFDNPKLHGSRVKIAISPDDIALSNEACVNISMQNQVRGTVRRILHMNNSFYVTVDCGIDLIAEITPRALYQLNIQLGNEIVCLFKAKAVEIIHIYD